MKPSTRRRGALALLALAGCGVAQQGCSPCQGSAEWERLYGSGGESPKEPKRDRQPRRFSFARGSGGESPGEARLFGWAGGGSGAAPVASLDAWVGQKCESFPNGQPDHIVETFQFTREGEIYVTTGTASGRNTYTRHGNKLQHRQAHHITARLQPNGELAWSHGYGSRIQGGGGW